MDRAGAALAGIAADVGAGQTLIVTQEIDEKSARIYVRGDAAPVDGEREFGHSASSGSVFLVCIGCDAFGVLDSSPLGNDTGRLLGAALQAPETAN